jgi:hypothetical protein
MEGLTWCELASGAERHAEVWRVGRLRGGGDGFWVCVGWELCKAAEVRGISVLADVCLVLG